MNGLSEKQAKTPKPLSNYLTCIGQHEPLAHRKVVELSRRARAGDMSALHELIEKNLRLVIFVAKKYAGFGLPLEDLVQEGSIGLIRAAQKFDPDLDYRFSTYAFTWIRQAIGKALTKQARTIRLPEHLADKIHKMLRKRNELCLELEREPTEKELAGRLGWSLREVRGVVDIAPDALSLNQPMGAEGTLAVLGDFVEDERTGDVPGAVIREIETEDLRKALRCLSERCRYVLVRRYGLDDETPDSLDVLAARLGVSRTRVWQVQRDAERILKYRGARPRSPEEIDPRLAPLTASFPIDTRANP